MQPVAWLALGIVALVKVSVGKQYIRALLLAYDKVKFKLYCSRVWQVQAAV